MAKATIKDQEWDELEIFSSLSSLFASTLELQETLDETVRLISGLTKADACFLYLSDHSSKDLILSASKTPHPHEIGHIRLKVGEGITGWVAKHQKPVSIPKRAHLDPRFIGMLPEDDFEAFLSVPISIKNNVVGVINIQHKKPHAHSKRFINLLTTIGRQIGAAIETARLYKETQKRSKALEALSAVSHTITQDHYPEEIMQLIPTSHQPCS
jgi:signal transduction protein with GAF and PtsI domain